VVVPIFPVVKLWSVYSLTVGPIDPIGPNKCGPPGGDPLLVQ
jgi:hypothetical protein